jgi:hypothetical protein
MGPYREGQTATGPNGQKAVYHGGQWVPLPAGAKARPDFGAGAYETQSGDIMATGARGQPTMLKQAPQQADANIRGRVMLGLDPAIQAQHDMQNAEAHGNPYNTFNGAIAAAVDGLDGANDHAGALSKAIGGDTYQGYNQASKTYEAMLLPIFSGSAVTPSEAQRQIRASLPQFGDSEQTLQRKALVRKMILNGAAEIAGAHKPFPEVGSWRGGTMQEQPQARPAPRPAAPAGQPKVRKFNPATGNIE